MLTQLNLWAGAAAGAVLVGAVLFGYNVLVDNPSVVRETTTKVEARAREITLTAINEVSDEAQRARAMRRYCRDNGMQFDFAAGSCRKS